MKLQKKLLTLMLCCLSAFAIGGCTACGEKEDNGEPSGNEQTGDIQGGGDTAGGNNNQGGGNQNGGDNNQGGGDNTGDNNNQGGADTGEEQTPTYTVIFDTDGGSAIASQQIEKDGKVTMPNAPSKKGNKFLGWSVNGEEWSFDTPITESIVLTAMWEPVQCTITLKMDTEHGGKVFGEGTFAYGESKTIRAETNMGYTFVGWYKGEEKVCETLKLTFRVKEDVTYTAKWEEVPVSVAQNDAAAGTVDGPTKTTLGEKVKITATTNKGYTFLGWYVGDELVTEEEVYQFSLSDNMERVTYTAKWTSYTLTTESDFSIAGTYSLYSEEKITAGESTTLTVTPNQNYTFLGWYDGDEKLSGDTSYTFQMPKESVTYTAKWQDDWKTIEGYNYWTFEQLGKQVMPIVGFNTPNASSADLGRKEGLPSQISLESYQTMKDCGFNVACGWWNDWKTYNVQDDVLKELDYADQVGMVYIVNDRNALYATTASGLSAFEEYMSKPAYGGTILIDEPGAVNFNAIANATRAWEASQYSNTLAYVNNLPNYAATWQLNDCQGTGGTPAGSFSNYEEWVQLYLNTVKPQVFSYDYYPYHYNDASFFRDGWYTNLSNVRYYTMKANVPFWVYGQVGVWKEYGSSEVRRKLSYGETAFQYNTMLAYGAKGIQYYNYYTPPNYTVENGFTACITTDGKKTDYYNYVQKINKQVAAVDQVLLMSKWQGLIQINNTPTAISSGDLVSSYGALTSATGVGDAIVGCFEYRDIGYAYYIASNSVYNNATVTLNFNDTYNLTKVQDATETQSRGNSITVSLPAGEGVLVVVPKN